MIADILADAGWTLQVSARRLEMEVSWPDLQSGHFESLSVYLKFKRPLDEILFTSA